MSDSRSPTEVSIRRAIPDDAPLLVQFIGALAEYEKLAHENHADAAALREHLAARACEAAVAELDARPVGFALWFETYSTFETARCLHLEDLFVVPDARGRGAGAALLREVARVAHERGCPRLQWNVLDWNESAIAFYERLGARVLPDWRVCRVEGAGIAKLAR